MRITLAAMTLAAMAGLSFSAATPVFQAQAQECTGENCPPCPVVGGHECESRKKEQTIS